MGLKSRISLKSCFYYELEEDNPIYDLQAPTFKAYFNGRNGISQLAKKINAHVEPEKFVS